MENIISIVSTLIVGIIVISLFNFAVIAMFYKKSRSGKAMVRTGFGGAKIETSKGIYVIPFFHNLEYLDITVKTLTIMCLGYESLICKDNLRADIKATFNLKVNYDHYSILRVAETLGADKAADIEVIREHFTPKLMEALKTVARKFTFEDLLDSRSEFRDEVVDKIGVDLNGYLLEKCAIQYIEKTNTPSIINF